MKNIVLITMITIISGLFVNCPKEKESNTGKIAAGLLLLGRNRQASGGNISANFPNSVTGSSAAISTTASGTAATGSATGTAVSGATSAASNLLEKSLKDAVSESKSNAQARLVFDTNTCNGTTKTANGTNVTTSVLNNTNSFGFVTAGTITIRPNLTTRITYNCTRPTTTNNDYIQRDNNTYASTGSLELVFANATVKYFDIESYVKNGTFVFKTSTLNGTINVSNLVYNSNDNSTFTYTAATQRFSSTNISSGTNSDSSKTTNLVVDGAAPASYDVVSNGTFAYEFASNGGYTNQTFNSCYTKLDFESGGRVTGTYNGSAVATSYNLTKEDYRKYVAAFGSPITFCQ